MGNIKLQKIGGSGGGSIATLSDVSLSSLIDNDILQYNSTSLAWENINLDTFLNANYLNLNCSNSPLLGSLGIALNEYSYTMTAAPLAYDGNEYDYNFDEGASFENCYFLNDKSTVNFIAITKSIEPISISSLDGTQDIGVALCNIFSGALYLTIYFKNDDFTDAADFDTWFEVIIDAGGDANTVSYFVKSIFTAGSPNYTWANPGGLSLCSNAAYTNPPQIYGSPTLGFSYNYNDASLTLKGNLSNSDGDGDILWWNGLLSIGPNQENPVLPKEQMGMQVAKTFTSTSNLIINVGADISPGLYPTGDTQSPLYGLFGSIQLSDQLYAGANFSGNYSSLNFTNFVDTTGNVGNMWGALLGLTFFKNGGTSDTYKGIGFAVYDSSGGGSRNLTNLIAFDAPYLGSSGGWAIGTYKGFSSPDNSAYATTSWGIYNEDRSYFAKDIVFPTSGGTVIGSSANEMFAFWGATPIVQPSATGEVSGISYNSAGTSIEDNTEFTGNVGSSAYTISDIVKHLKNLGLLAQ